MHGGTILFALSLCVRTVPNPTQASKPHNTKESPSPVDKKKIQEQRGNDRRKKRRTKEREPKCSNNNHKEGCLPQHTYFFLRSMKNAKLVVINASFMCSQYRTIRITQYSAVSILKGTHGNALYTKTFT